MAAGPNKTSASGRFSIVLNILSALSGLCFICASARADIRSAVIDKQTGQLFVLEGYQEDYVAWANFTDDIKTSG